MEMAPAATELAPPGVQTWEPTCFTLPPLSDQRFSDLVASRLGQACAAEAAKVMPSCVAAGQRQPGFCFQAASLPDVPLYVALAWTGQGSGAQSKALSRTRALMQAASLHALAVTPPSAGRVLQVPFSPGLSPAVPDLLAALTAGMPALCPCAAGDRPAKPKQGHVAWLMGVVRRHRAGTIGAGSGGEADVGELTPVAAPSPAGAQTLARLDLRSVGCGAIMQAPAISTHTEWSIALAACVGERSLQMTCLSVPLKGCSRLLHLNRHTPWASAVEAGGPLARPAQFSVEPWEPVASKAGLLENAVLVHHLGLSSKKMAVQAVASSELARTQCGRPLLPVEVGWPHLPRPLPPSAELPRELSILRVGDAAAADPRHQALVEAIRGFVRAAVKEVLGKPITRDDRRLEAEGLLPSHVPQLIGVLESHLSTLGVPASQLPATLADDYPTVSAIADLIAGSFSVSTAGGATQQKALSRTAQQSKQATKRIHLIRPQKVSQAPPYIGAWPENAQRLRWHTPFYRRQGWT